MRYALIIWLIFRDLLRIIFATFFKSRLQKFTFTRKPFKNNVIKWKTKQSWKGNVWKYLLILPIFFTWGRKLCWQNMLFLLKTNKKVFYFIFLDQKSSIQNKKYIHVTHTTYWNVSLPRSNVLIYTSNPQRNDIRTIFPDDFPSKIHTFRQS